MIEFIIGIILGIIFFGGLYLTVLKMKKVRNPKMLMVVSFILRMAVLLGGLFYVSRNGYKGILFALFGIILLRFIMIYYYKQPARKN